MRRRGVSEADLEKWVAADPSDASDWTSPVMDDNRAAAAPEDRTDASLVARARRAILRVTGSALRPKSTDQSAIRRGDLPSNDFQALAQRTLSRALEAGRQLRARHARSKEVVEQLLAMAPPERWRRHARSSDLAGLAVLKELLVRAGDQRLDTETRRDLALWVLHSAAAHGPAPLPARLTTDSMASANLVLAGVALERRDALQTDFHLAIARALASVGSGDPLLHAEADLFAALLSWRNGFPARAVALLGRVKSLAHQLSDPTLEAKAWLWLAEFRRLESDTDGSAKAMARALQALDEESVESLKRQIERLGAGLREGEETR